MECVIYVEGHCVPENVFSDTQALGFVFFKTIFLFGMFFQQRWVLLLRIFRKSFSGFYKEIFHFHSEKLIRAFRMGFSLPTLSIQSCALPIYHKTLEILMKRCRFGFWTQLGRISKQKRGVHRNSSLRHVRASLKTKQGKLSHQP